MKTEDLNYTTRLLHLPWWKRIFDVQRPYRNHIQSLNLGPVLEIGCGIGRNLINLGARKQDIGVDHNPTSVNECNQRGLTAFTPNEFFSSAYAKPQSFDALLVAHVMEHLKKEEAINLLRIYTPFIKSDGKIIIITPQEAGFASDPTHVTMMNHEQVSKILNDFCKPNILQYSFPFPLVVGKFFKYNENISIGTKLN